MVARFGDPERGGFFSTSDDHEALIARRKEVGDHPIPSGNSSAAMGLLRLAALSGERAYEEQAEGVLRLYGEPRRGSPTPSPICCGHSTSISPRSRRSRWSATASTPWPPSSAAATALTSSSPAALRGPRPPSCSAAAPRSAARRPPTSARASPARRP